jgi:hypothetical protein
LDKLKTCLSYQASPVYRRSSVRNFDRDWSN